MKKPFTLVEVLIAMSVLSVFLLGLMQFYSSTETVLSSGVERTEMFERARIAMDMMANDLSCVYYSQTDDDLKPFDYSENSFFSVSTVRPEKLNRNAKTNIIAVKYNWNKGKRTLVYSSDNNGDNFGVDGANFGNETELVEGVTDFKVTPIFGKEPDGKDFKILPALVVIRMELIDSKALKRLKANSGADDSILKNANRREFRRMVVIDRGQPKPKL